jgi:hypothetical protein
MALDYDIGNHPHCFLDLAFITEQNKIKNCPEQLGGFFITKSPWINPGAG